MRNLHRPNKYDSPCRLCGGVVEANTGILMAEKGRYITYQRDKNPKFLVQHKKTKYCRKQEKINAQ